MAVVEIGDNHEVRSTPFGQHPLDPIPQLEHPLQCVRLWPGQQERAEAALTPDEIQAEHERYRAWFEASGDFPHIAKLMKSDVDPDDPNTREERFQFSLDCVLDGIAARLAAAGARPAPPG